MGGDEIGGGEEIKGSVMKLGGENEGESVREKGIVRK